MPLAQIDMKRLPTHSIILQMLLIIAAALLFVSPAAAQTTVTDDLVNEVSKGLYCPVCESEPLDTCPTQACIDWRAEIRAQLEAGRTQEQIYDDFVTRYGERVLAQPSASGLNLILWFGMPIALLIGGYYFYAYLRRIAIDSPEPIEAQKPIQKQNDSRTIDDYLEQIEQEIKTVE